ncbi:uncharacterized protein LOC103860540 [Brassica rapa]|uniref:uncharacterized protein LOC103860540 n=1 Tax=Brassica campestris TaxID=3711 RepID=UPI00142D417A|nr:uncharacterized protein LOC103860540 [Brassica rapa]
MAEMSYLQIHDANDAVLNHFNRNLHQRRQHHQSLSQILDSLPHWVQSDDDVDLYVSQSELDVSAAVGLDLLERRSFVMDLFHQRVEQSQVSPLGGDYESAGSDSGFGVVEGDRDMRGGSLGLDFGLGLGSGRGFVDCDDDDDEDDLFDGIRYLGMDSGDVIVTVESGFDSDVEEDDPEKEIWGVDLNEEDEYVNDDDDDDDDDDDEDEDDSVTIPLCWDSLNLEDNEEEFEWEEVDDGDEREVSAEGDDNNSVSVSVSATISQEDLAIGERRGYLGWEVLLNSRSLEFNLDDAESNMELYIGGDIDQQEDDEDYLHTTEYEMLFEAEISSGLGKPPASKSFIKNLKVSPLTKEDVTEENDGDAMCCAVCREEMSVGNEVAELPCRHKYHGECIVPWLGIRNTCPVCRFELPSDETEQSRF